MRKTPLLLSALLAALLAAWALPAVAQAKDMHRIAYGLLLNKNGKWLGPTLADGSPDPRVVTRIIKAKPKHLRLTSASNDCRVRCPIPIPDDPDVLEQLLRLRQAGIRLGVGLNVARHGIDRERELFRKRRVKEVLRHACEIKAADEHRLYSWIFFDFAGQQPKLRMLVKKARSGRGCAAGGWRNVMINLSGHDRAGRLPGGGLSFARRFTVLGKGAASLRRYLQKVARGRKPALTNSDRAYIEDLKRRNPRAQVILKLEIPHQTTEIFGKLPASVQRGLLRRWHRVAKQNGVTLIYPLFVYPPGRGVSVYDSRREGTYKLVRRLLRDAGPAAQSLKRAKRGKRKSGRLAQVPKGKRKAKRRGARRCAQRKSMRAKLLCKVRSKKNKRRGRRR